MAVVELERLFHQPRQLQQLRNQRAFLRAQLGRFLPSAMVSIASAVSCVVNALVEATPISGPARVSSTKFDSRTMELSATLQMVSVDRYCGLPGVAQRRQRVGGLAGLRNGHEQRIRRDDGIAIAVFAGNLDPRRNPADLLDQIAGDEARVKTRAAGGDVNRFDALENLGGAGTEGGIQ